jgi:RNA polymerase sigma-70 factor, ECF subfamily
MSPGEPADPEAWVDRHGDSLYRYALLRLRTPELAADVVQETFLEALRARGTFAGRSSERTWLVGILRHKIIDYLRKSGREAAPVNGTWEEHSAAALFDRRGHWRFGRTSWPGDPSRELESQEFWDAIASCLSKLPKGLGDAFLLREMDDLNADEVQEILGITPANFWKRLHRARLLLRQCLETSWFGPRSSRPPLPQKGSSRS